MRESHGVGQELPRRKLDASRAGLEIRAGWVVAALALAVAGCVPSGPAGAEFRKHCEPVAAEGDVEICMEQMSRVYRGPDVDRNKNNAAAQWARDYYGDGGRPG